ncbi:MAG: hypothetical protein JW864_07730 [Spirochaetes bacterium]|nr:hypothetical protein [Spirochaetota bacterium]
MELSLITKYFEGKLMQKKTKGVLLILSIVLFFSCSTWNNKSWENLEDRTFYLSEFFIEKKLSDSDEIFKLMKEFPLYKVLKLISNKYNLEVDSSEFSDFLIMNDETRLKIGGLTGSKYTWETEKQKDNTIEIQYWYVLNERNPAQSARSYKIYLKVKGKKRAIFEGYFIDTVPDHVIIAKGMNYSPADKKNKNLFINKDNNTTLDITDAKKDIITVSKEDDKLSKPELKKLVGDFIKDLPKSERKEFRDDLIKYLYRIVE